VRVPLSWLRDFVDYRGTPEELANRLGTSGFEIEGLLRPGAPDIEANHACFVIGRVTHFEKHPNADRLRLCRVDVGEAEPRQIVCGASNFAVGDTVVVALPGAILPGADAPLKRAKLRGETSDGMMLSERELGISDDHDGIIALPTGAMEIGSPLRDHIALDEVILDVGVESNRGDCLSIHGMAREVATLFGLELAPVPEGTPPAAGGRTGDLVAIAIDAPERCSRFTVRGFVDVAIGPSPLRVRQRLAAAGVRPISNVVDATNYVMHELGNPLHAYDADRIPGATLVARLARAGETVQTLDGRERALTEDMLVIADADGPSGIAGIMGGAVSEITAATTRVVLEAACFERGGIQRTSRALGLRTDGSARWEKGVNPHLAPAASARAASLIAEWSGATMLDGLLDVAPGLPEPQTVTLRTGRVGQVLGLEVPEDETERILSGLGYAPTQTDQGWACTVPEWRWLDATREIDLVEEIGRIHGLERVPAVLPRVPPGLGGLTPIQRLQRRVEDHLAGAGLREVTTLSLVDPDSRSAFGLTGDDAVALRNPLSADLSELRVSLMPSLLEVVRHNASVGVRDVQVFELGRVHRVVPDGDVREEPRLGLCLAGRLAGRSWLGDGPPCDLGTGLGVIDVLLSRFGIDASRSAAVDVPHLHPGRAAEIRCGDDLLGVVGEVHPAVVSRLDIDGPVVIADLDLEAMLRSMPHAASFRGLSPFPPVLQDIAVVVSDDVTSAEVLAAIGDAGGDHLAHAEVFDVYRDADRLGVGQVSLAVRLTFRADDRTLTEDEASAAREVVVASLAERLGAELRA
jgi:phenylalanyl-tRNA synthetase beta chain